jgi:hypothetical protein
LAGVEKRLLTIISGITDNHNLVFFNINIRPSSNRYSWDDCVLSDN